jgi:hypothetical protein
VVFGLAVVSVRRSGSWPAVLGGRWAAAGRHGGAAVAVPAWAGIDRVCALRPVQRAPELTQLALIEIGDLERLEVAVVVLPQY